MTAQERITEETLDELQRLQYRMHALDRAPFRELLAKLMHCAPDEQSILEFASKQPDRWAQAISIFGKLSGFADRIEKDVNVWVQIQGMSDLEIEQRLAELENVVHSIPGEVEPQALPDETGQGAT